MDRKRGERGSCPQNLGLIRLLDRQISRLEVGEIWDVDLILSPTLTWHWWCGINFCALISVNEDNCCSDPREMIPSIMAWHVASSSAIRVKWFLQSWPDTSHHRQRCAWNDLFNHGPTHHVTRQRSSWNALCPIRFCHVVLAPANEKKSHLCLIRREKVHPFFHWPPPPRLTCIDLGRRKSALSY